MDFWQLIEKRRSTRSFLPKPVEPEKLEKILQAANKAPSARNNQSYRIFVLEKEKEKKKLAEACMGQEFIGQASVCLVFATWIEDTSVISEKSNFYAQLDATIACYQAWLAAVDLDLSGVWIGAYRDEDIIELLDLQFGQRPVAVLPLGYASEKPSVKERMLLENLVIKK